MCFAAPRALRLLGAAGPRGRRRRRYLISGRVSSGLGVAAAGSVLGFPSRRGVLCLDCAAGWGGGDVFRGFFFGIFRGVLRWVR